MLNILIPAAGRGRRFQEAGYTLPKPLIDVNGRPMIHRVMDDLRPTRDHGFILLVLWEHLDRMLFPGVRTMSLPDVTDGAARTVLHAKRLIDNDDPLIVANADQLLGWNVDEFLGWTDVWGPDGAVVTFHADHPKWSFVRTMDGRVTEVAEKKVISNEATCGVYYWRRGSDLVRSIEKMIAKDIRTNGEFYLAPSYNELIAEGKFILPYPITRMHGLGTPEDLEAYVQAFGKETHAVAGAAA